MSQPPNPKRFDSFTQLKDGSGFVIKDSDFVFKYDRFGGWFDEYGNYYDANANPDDPPSDSEHSDNLSRSQGSYNDPDEDEFERQFGGPKTYQDEDDTGDVHYEKIASNLAVLNSYPAGKPFRVQFRNFPYLSNREEVFNHYNQKIPGILNVVFLENEKRQFNGNGYFVVDNIKAGESLLKLQGDKYNGRDVHFSVVEVEEFLQDPVESDELYPDFGSKNKNKNYITKGPKSQIQKEEVKTEKFQPPPVEPKVEKPAEAKQKSEPKKEQDPESFAVYKFLKTAFPLKSSFKQWIEDNKFSHKEDIQKIQKIENDQIYALVTMKRKVFNKLNGKYYSGNKIVFEPQAK